MEKNKSKTKICSVCEGEICGEYFLVKHGKPIPLDDFNARVCIYNKKDPSACINPLRNPNTKNKYYPSEYSVDPETEKTLIDIAENHLPDLNNQIRVMNMILPEDKKAQPLSKKELLDYVKDLKNLPSL